MFESNKLDDLNSYFSKFCLKYKNVKKQLEETKKENKVLT